ncbi:MAG: hypothetical protein JXB15_12325 [Anaerolineales bacterium]|nr:hypothetical protein [Anaerolineales bacterium]
MNKILLVTVTKVEAQAVLRLFKQATGRAWERLHLGDKTYYSAGEIGGAEVLMTQSEMGTSGPGAALLTVHKGIEDLAPAAVIMVGIAFGVNPEKQQLGEILVSRQIQAYEAQKVKGKKLIPRGDRVAASTRLLDRFRSADLDWPGAKVHFGLVLSGEKLIADEAFRDRLLKLEPEAIGGEMEGAGLYAAASDARVDWILVKAICDWADGNKNDGAQSQAAENAAGFVLYTLQQGGWDAFSAAAVQGEGEIIQQTAGDNSIQIGKARDVHIHR